MAAIVEWNEQIKDKVPFAVGICARFKLKGSIINDESLALLQKKVKAPLVFSTNMTEIPPQSRGAIVVIERGGISFAKKYELAQAAGCAGLIIANNDELNPKSIFSVVGEIQLTQETILKEGLTGTAASIVRGFNDEKLPCIMISQSSYRRLLEDSPNTLYLSLLANEHLKKIPTCDLGACIRGTVTFGAEELLKELLKELLHRHSSDPYGDDNEILQEVLEDAEVDRNATALHLAVESQQLACLSMLVRSGADTEAMKNDGYTALQLAAEIGHSEITTIIASSNSYIDHQHPLGWTALHMACKAGAADVATILIEGGADVDVRAKDGCTPLHVACLHGSIECIKVLLDAGCDINVKSTLGALPYEVALYSGHPHAAVIIEQAESNPIISEKLEYFTFRLPPCLRGKKNDKLKQSISYDYEEEFFDEVDDEEDDFSEYNIEGKILEEDVLSISTETWDGFEGEDSKESPKTETGAFQTITSYLQLGLTPLVSATSVLGRSSPMGFLSRSPSYEVSNSGNSSPRPKSKTFMRSNPSSELSLVSMKLDSQLKAAEENTSMISGSTASTGSLADYFNNASLESQEISETLAALSDNPDISSKAQKLADQYIEETLAALSDGGNEIPVKSTNRQGEQTNHNNGNSNNMSSPMRTRNNNNNNNGNSSSPVRTGSPFRSPTRKRDVHSPKKVRKLENETLGFTWLVNLNKYKCFSVSIEESLFEKEDHKVVIDIEQSIDLMNMDLDRCCFREFTKSKRKTLLRIAAKILITRDVSTILTDNDDHAYNWPQIRYRQGMLSLLAPIVEAWFESYIDNSSTDDQNSDNLDVVEMKFMRKVLETFHSLLEVFEPLKHYYCHENANSNSLPFQQVFDIALHILRYWASDVYSCLVWRGMDLTLFAIPWTSTLMADALPLPNVLHLWSKLFEAILVGKSSDVESHISFLSSISGNSSSFNASGILASLISSVLLQLTQHISPSICHDDNIDDDDGSDGNKELETDDTKFDSLPAAEELLLLFSSVNNADTGEETRYSIFDEQMICHGIEYLLSNSPKVILNGKSYKNTEDAFLYRHLWGEQNDDWGSIWTNFRAAPVFFIHEIDLKSLYPCLIIQMDDNITNTLSDDLIRFLGPKSPHRSKVDYEPDTITASMIVDKLNAYLHKNGVSNVNECKFRELRIKGMIKFFRNWALSLSDEQGSLGLSLKSKSSEFGEVKGIARIRMKTKISKGWTGILDEPPERIPKVNSTLGKSLNKFGSKSNNAKPAVIIIEYDKDILNDDRKKHTDSIIDAQDVAAVLTICNVTNVIIRSL